MSAHTGHLELDLLPRRRKGFDPLVHVARSIRTFTETAVFPRNNNRISTNTWRTGTHHNKRCSTHPSEICVWRIHPSEMSIWRIHPSELSIWRIHPNEMCIWRKHPCEMCIWRIHPSEM